MPIWVPCPNGCDDFMCRIHQMHTADCSCPTLDEQVLAGNDPYATDENGNSNDQQVLFELPEAPVDWEREWQGMPEFIQEKRRPYAQIIVRFRGQADLDNFAELVGQKLTRRTKSMWHPMRLRGIHSTKRYTDES